MESPNLRLLPPNFSTMDPRFSLLLILSILLLCTTSFVSLSKTVSAGPSATSHHVSSLPSSRHLASILSLGNCAPRATAIAALMSRLHRTRSATVALKCLLLLHSVVRRGSFILHGQISLFQASSGNCINQLTFRNGSSHRPLPPILHPRMVTGGIVAMRVHDDSVPKPSRSSSCPFLVFRRRGWSHMTCMCSHQKGQ